MSLTAPRYSIGLEQGADAAFRAHSLDLLGLEEVGDSPESAVHRFTGSLQRRLSEVARMGWPVPAVDAELELAVDEWVETDARVAQGETHACFEADLVALSAARTTEALQLLGDVRARLLPHIRRARNEALEEVGGAGTSLRLVLDELARSQWWMLSRLGASALAEVPDQTVARLDTAMALVVQRMTTLSDDARGRSIVLDDERWTPRKVLRRLLWLEWSLGDAALDRIGAAAGAA